MALNGFTPTQKKILALLDTAPRTRDQLRTGLGDEFMEDSSISFHISTLRAKLGVFGQDIVCRRGEYQLVRLTKSASRE